MAKVKSVILLSGGLDSTVNAWMAKVESDPVLSLTFDYGQKAAAKEIEAAQKISKKLGIPHQVIALPWFERFSESALSKNSEEELPTNVSLDDFAASRESAKAVWVPNRNGVFLNVAAAFAESLGAKWIIPGFNLEEASTFPDNSEEYMEAADRSLFYSTANHVAVKCFTVHMNKAEIVVLGRQLGANLTDVWPCYLGGETPCGRCESCQRFFRALGT